MKALTKTTIALEPKRGGARSKKKIPALRCSLSKLVPAPLAPAENEFGEF